MLIFFSDDELVKRLNHLCSVSGISQSNFIEQAAKYFLSSPEVIKILEGEAKLSQLQLRSVSKLKSTSRVAALMDFLSGLDNQETSDRYKKIIAMRFGLGEYKPHTLEEIGKDFGISRERVRQIISQLLLNPAEESVAGLFDPFHELTEKESFELPGLINKVEQEFDLDIDKTIKEIAHFFSTDYAELMSRSRHGEIALIRQIAMFILKESYNLSASRIGKIFNRDHSTVLYALSAIRNKVDTDSKFSQLVHKVMQPSSDIINETGEKQNEIQDDGIPAGQYDVFLLPKVTENGVEIDTANVMQTVINKLDELNIPPNIKNTIKKVVAQFFASLRRDKPTELSLYKTRVDHLDLPTRTLSSLNRANISTLGGLIKKSKSELLEIEGLGHKSVKEIEELLEKIDKRLKPSE